MLILPLYGICALALTGIFFPWIKALQEPSISLIYTASAISQDCFKDFSDWLQLSTEDVGRVVSRPLSSLPRIICLPTPSSSSSSSNIWNGPKDFIVLPTDSSLATVTQSENSLSLVTPFKVHPPRVPPPLSVESGSAVTNDAGETFDPEELTISNDGLPLFLGLVVSVLVAFHLVVYVGWKRELAKFDRDMEEAKTTASKMLEDLSKAKIVLDKTEGSYLKGVMDSLDTTSKQTSSEAQINILEYLYIEESSSAPVLFSTKRWTLPKSEFESKYGAVPRAPPFVEPSTVVPPLPVEEASKDSDSGSGNDDRGVAAANNAQPEPRQLDNGGRPTSIHGANHISTVVPNFHVERPLVRKRPFVPVLARHSQRPRRPPRPPTGSIVLDRIRTPAPAMVGIHAGGASDTNTDLRRRENVASPSTMVNIHVEGASVAKVTGAGVADTEDGYDSSTSVQTTILAPRTPSAAAATAATAATARVEVQASPQTQTESPQTESPQTGRRRKNRMGQRQRRWLREMRAIENRGWEAIQSSQQGGCVFSFSMDSVLRMPGVDYCSMSVSLLP